MKKFTTRDIVLTGVMAAICFVTIYLSIPIQTPTGPSMIKVANIFCLLAGMLLGGLKGGLAAGIGSMLYDLLDPRFISYAPFTLIFFFVMAFVCGVISNLPKGNRTMLNIVGGIAGAASYIVLNIGYNIVLLMLAGGENSSFIAAFMANTPKLFTSTLNAIIAVVVSTLLYPALKKVVKLQSKA